MGILRSLLLNGHLAFPSGDSILSSAVLLTVLIVGVYEGIPKLRVENAVKHNIILPDQPLIIEITTTADGSVQVANNLQRKPSRVISNGVGITNILSTYQMLNQPRPMVHEANGQFRVVLSLINHAT
ncbi:hypothetical protein [Larkinella rosea]|uniref:Uncharacterized protein n=1 Tax=Larkinella rosea TaxID=2025312 RepID=A0A3P1BD60_9BACT|nr:hypothetical protein [Larkinella rosea]RRA98851.1 hypothetical protein EHT25_28075 [Larkinella rosea]